MLNSCQFLAREGFILDPLPPPHCYMKMASNTEVAAPSIAGAGVANTNGTTVGQSRYFILFCCIYFMVTRIHNLTPFCIVLFSS
jgi:hypothetical protein